MLVKSHGHERNIMTWSGLEPRLDSEFSTVIFIYIFIRQHHTKWLPCIKWSVFKVKNFSPLVTVIFTSIKWSPVLTVMYCPPSLY